MTAPVLSDFSLWDGLAFTVEGRRFRPRGIFHRRVTLPGIPTNVEATVTGALPGTHRLVVDGTAYPVGPPVPLGLKVLALLPFLLGLPIKGSLGWLVVALALPCNSRILLSSRTNVAKAALLVATLLVGAGVEVALAVWLAATWWQ
ncbi:hypothetical protein [Intrasporangium flavum]|uniref:hypothetical protein n=1 Tax=Intrasporangium flavum TaxID=1428657 RepID=UPI001A978242|nr:hypothetical protein [Intrasporangium flavum]